MPIILANALGIKIDIYSQTYVLEVPPENRPLELTTICVLKTGEHYDSLIPKPLAPVLDTFNDILYHTTCTMLENDAATKDSIFNAISACLKEIGQQVDTETIRNAFNKELLHGYDMYQSYYLATQGQETFDNDITFHAEGRRTSSTFEELLPRILSNALQISITICSETHSITSAPTSICIDPSHIIQLQKCGNKYKALVRDVTRQQHRPPPQRPNLRRKQPAPRRKVTSTTNDPCNPLTQDIKIGALNINGLTSKLKLAIFDRTVMDYDIICLSETLTNLPDLTNTQLSDFEVLVQPSKEVV